jgi:signal transduction histidine kinase
VGEAKSALKLLVPNINAALDEVRRLVMNLRPSLLDDLGILATLSWFVREFQSLYPAICIETEFAITEADVPDALKLTLFRVVQEAMNNVAKHSHATSVRICAEISKSELRLSITDNGVGFDRAEVESRRGLRRTHGQLCLRERAESSGGKIAIVTAIGKGVCVRMSWPCSPLCVDVDFEPAPLRLDVRMPEHEV